VAENLSTVTEIGQAPISVDAEWAAAGADLIAAIIIIIISIIIIIILISIGPVSLEMTVVAPIGTVEGPDLSVVVVVAVVPARVECQLK